MSSATQCSDSLRTDGKTEDSYSYDRYRDNNTDKVMRKSHDKL